MARFRDYDWNVREGDGDKTSAANVHEAVLAVLMDIRERLDVLRCQGFQSVPMRLANIERNTRKPRKTKR